MRSKVKVILLGLSNAGKSTIVLHLKSRGWPIVEADDIVRLRNNNVWPEDEQVIFKLFDEINDEVVDYDDGIFVTSFLDTPTLHRFVTKGFNIVEVYAGYEELIRRKIKRDGIPKDNYARYNRHYKAYTEEVTKYKNLLSLRYDTTHAKSGMLSDDIERKILL